MFRIILRQYYQPCISIQIYKLPRRDFYSGSKQLSVLFRGSLRGSAVEDLRAILSSINTAYKQHWL